MAVQLERRRSKAVGFNRGERLKESNTTHAIGWKGEKTNPRPGLCSARDIRSWCGRFLTEFDLAGSEFSA